jgi:hypothetical protein
MSVPAARMRPFRASPFADLCRFCGSRIGPGHLSESDCIAALRQHIRDLRPVRPVQRPRTVAPVVAEPAEAAEPAAIEPGRASLSAARG